MWNTAVKKRAGGATNAPARGNEEVTSMQAERTEQEQLEQQLRETIRKLRESGMFACEVEDILIDELMRDD